MLNGIDIYIYIVKKYSVFKHQKNFVSLTEVIFFFFCFFLRGGGGRTNK